MSLLNYLKEGILPTKDKYLFTLIQPYIGYDGRRTFVYNSDDPFEAILWEYSDDKQTVLLAFPDIALPQSNNPFGEISDPTGEGIRTINVDVSNIEEVDDLGDYILKGGRRRKRKSCKKRKCKRRKSHRRKRHY